ncbi:MAG: lipid-A-disaccharide synthase, partial [Deltaproteobacteria bacterium]|nr:lipid-A-disaccharide synthase [Deltaproteobacteria bacterium]
MKRIMIVAGEASGDLHGSNLVRAAMSLDPDLKFYGLGGENLREAGIDLLFDLEHQG